MQVEGRNRALAVSWDLGPWSQHLPDEAWSGLSHWPRSGSGQDQCFGPGVWSRGAGGGGETTSHRSSQKSRAQSMDILEKGVAIWACTRDVWQKFKIKTYCWRLLFDGICSESCRCFHRTWLLVFGVHLEFVEFDIMSNTTMIFSLCNSSDFIQDTVLSK